MAVEYEVGQTVTSAITVYDGPPPNGIPIDLGVAPACTITLPDGTTFDAAVVSTSVGIYQGAYTSTQVGTHRLRWTSIDQPNAGAFPISDTFEVWAANPRFIISLSEARDALNLAPTNTTNDNEIRLYVATATNLIEDVLGPVMPTSVTMTFDGGRPNLILNDTVISGVTSVAVNGTVLNPSSYNVDLAAGIVWMTYGTFAFGARNVSVVYTIGATKIAPNITLAARELVRHLWQFGQQASRPAFGVDEYETVPATYTMPRRVLELLEPQRKTAL